MLKFTILAGGFSQFIATYLFDSDASSLTLVKQTQTAGNPSWIASHPQNSSILYAVNEIGPIGNLQSFVVGSMSTFDWRGDSHELRLGELLLRFTVPGDLLHFVKDSPVVAFPVADGVSHPHMSLEYNGEVFVPDLGADKIWRLVNDGAPGKFKIQGQIDIDAGAGPRHIAIQDNILFTLHEFTST
ncbi:putative lactonase, 7-bladed beta-propeller [Lyophyllum shimeji]|uniref:Lactonase, 7-bladed beta-propeller n=1 Tax=Lyophyllum shimeji TaxID=47721 RepID=A0A9P3PSK0_LYOSH|nr:putative lactonase, 7-bladed beta-propeller [Lyophyllum shimeji]